jgi:hypothetical protein
MKQRYAILVMMCAVLFVAGCAGCGSGGGSGAPTADDAANATETMAQANPGPQTGLPVTTVRVVADSQITALSADVAATPETQQTGLMYVYQMPQDKGMLFVFDGDQIRSFWMQNTYIQLDMLFINFAGVVVDINEQAQPLSTTTYSSKAPARYVLEVNGGWCAANGVKVGDTVLIDGY